MASYTYLMSSLPMLHPEGEAPLSYADFVDQCSNSVPPSLLEQLRTLTLTSTGAPLLDRWAAFYRALTAELTYRRRTRLNQPAQEVTDSDADAFRIANAVMSEPNPLKAELLLLTLEFEQLNAFIGTHAFDEEALLGYALQLQLLERKGIFVQKDGQTELKRILDHLQQQIMKI